MNLLFYEFKLPGKTNPFSLHLPNAETALLRSAAENEGFKTFLQDSRITGNLKEIVPNCSAVFINADYSGYPKINSDIPVIIYGNAARNFPCFKFSGSAVYLTRIGQNIIPLMQALKNNTSLKHIPSVFTSPDFTAPDYSEDFLHLPFYQPELKYWRSSVKQPYYVQLFKGCSKNCVRCSLALAAKHYSEKPSEARINYVLDEIRCHKNSHIIFTDTNLIPSKHHKKYVQELKNLSVQYTAQLCIQSFSPEIPDILAESGCSHIILNIWDQRGSEIKDTVTRLKKCGISVSLHMLTVYPECSISETVHTINSAAPKNIFFSPWICWPESREYQKWFIKSPDTVIKKPDIKSALNTHNAFVRACAQKISLKNGIVSAEFPLKNVIKKLKWKYCVP